MALAIAAFTLFATAPLSQARKGADDPAGHDSGDDKGGRRAPGATDDPADHDINDDKGGLRAPGTTDDPADHDSNDDKGGQRAPGTSDDLPGGDQGGTLKKGGKGRGGKDDAPGHT
ncbi:hypothetical protein [Horticoccus sp. 23ND18S-11]|uniref:hypothetical protein n=1 Tax=Horticoccus sp. 23ND18S-11 TaxID=3391832 RepID=UPI0039C9D133